MNCMFEVCQ